VDLVAAGRRVAEMQIREEQCLVHARGMGVIEGKVTVIYVLIVLMC